MSCSFTSLICVRGHVSLLTECYANLDKAQHKLPLPCHILGWVFSLFFEGMGEECEGGIKDDGGEGGGGGKLLLCS